MHPKNTDILLSLSKVRSVAHAELTNPNAIATKLTLKVRLKNFIVFHINSLDYKKANLLNKLAWILPI